MQCDVKGCIITSRALGPTIYACIDHEDEWREYIRTQSYISWADWAAKQRVFQRTIWDEPAGAYLGIEKMLDPSCECGSSAVGSPKHSNWCPLND